MPDPGEAEKAHEPAITQFLKTVEHAADAVNIVETEHHLPHRPVPPGGHVVVYLDQVDVGPAQPFQALLHRGDHRFFGRFALLGGEADLRREDDLRPQSLERGAQVGF